ncbi:MAG TPA: haloacid dehalogenase-like hydrolase [Gaiellaceae bacterium]|nr:haloacid dehalogenase-like hydrolase [Gaiellaceae bacterium]
MAARVVVDWDGTVTCEDGLVQVLHAFGDPRLLAELEPRVGVDLTLHEEIALELASVTAPLEEVVAWVREHVRVRPGFAAFAERHRPTILSSGFGELIEPVLEREGVTGLEVQANSVQPRPDGWRVRWRDEAQCTACGEACKRGSLPDGDVVYVGDGYSDRCAALAAGRVFARDGLARYLDAEGVAYERFADFGDVAAALGAEPGSGAVERPSRSRGRNT